MRNIEGQYEVRLWVKREITGNFDLQELLNFIKPLRSACKGKWERK